MAGFCPKCGTLFNITQNIKLFKRSQSGGKTVAGRIDKLLDKIETRKDIDEKDLKDITYDDLNSYAEFNSLARKRKTEIISKIKKIIPGYDKISKEEKEDDDTETDNKPYYICYECYNFVPIKAGDEIYSMELMGDDQNVKEDFEHLIHDPTYNRTKVYICENKKCPTHKEPDLREAIMTHNAQYNLRYVCTVCKSSWLS